jgi:hypothetical protein
VAYCVRADLYDMGLPRGGLVNPARLADSVNVAANAILLGSHGFDLNSPLSLRAENGGELPQPLVEGVQYFAIPLSDDALQLAAMTGGSAIPLLTSGDRVLLFAPVPIDAAIEWGAGLIDDSLPAHVVPLASPYPPIIVFTNAELAIGKLMNGSASASLAQMVDAATKRLAKWAQGVPLRGTNTANQTPSNTAVAPLFAAYGDSQGWTRNRGLC